MLERAHRADDVARIRAHLVVGAKRQPAHDAAAIEQHRGRSGHIAAVGAAVGVHEAIAARDRQVAIGDEAIIQLQPVRQALALRIVIGGDGDDLDPGTLRVGQRGSKTLELGDAERSPVAAIEDQQHAFRFI